MIMVDDVTNIGFLTIFFSVRNFINIDEDDDNKIHGENERRKKEPIKNIFSENLRKKIYFNQKKEKTSKN